ncbi:MAG: hypothetical protein JWL64_777 [Frankiales bacterium]|nr:hypothetical protein [Frankiales bacterium]
MPSQEIDLRDHVLTNESTRGDIVPLIDEMDESTFDTSYRGYNKAQVEDYLNRVESALNEADERHLLDTKRFESFEAELTQLREALAQAQEQAAGKPPPASLVGQRLAAMLKLAEEEAAAIRSAASQEAAQIVADARRQAEQESAQRMSVLEAQERRIAGAAETADRIRHDAETEAQEVRAAAQRDAEQGLGRAQQAAAELTAQAERQAEQMRTQTAEEIRQAHEDARKENALRVEEARLQVRDLGRQRDAITKQLDTLKTQLNSVVDSIS